MCFSSALQRGGDPEKEQGPTTEPDCVRCPPSVQWLDLGQSLVYEDLLGRYQTLLQALSSEALWLQLNVPQAGNTAGSVNLRGVHRVLQILQQTRQVSETGGTLMCQ